MNLRKIRWSLVAVVLAAWLPIAITAAYPALWQWSKTAANNATADGTINWREGMPPSAVNDSARAMMARVAEWRDDIAGAIVTGGTSTAYTLASNQVFDTLAHMNGAKICFAPHTTNGATVTLAVDGLTARPLRSSPSVEIGAGVLVQGSPYCATYNNSDTAFYLEGFYGNPFVVPLGVILDYTGDTAPNSNFAIADGSCISRTTYAAYFALVSTRFSVCDGTTTFGIPDLNGRVTAGQDNQGSGAKNRLTSSGNGCGTAFTSVGAVCANGSESVSILQGNIPNYNLNASGLSVSGTAAVTGRASATFGVTNEPTLSDGGGGAVVQNAAISATAGGVIASGGSGTPISRVQPVMAVKKIVRIF